MKGETMSKATREFFERAMQDALPPMGAVKAAAEGVKLAVEAYAPDLTLGKILSDIGHELSEQTKHGAHELASALFTGNSYVQYARHDKEDAPDHGLPEMQRESQGREM
jgi:hypothetical protein